MSRALVRARAAQRRLYRLAPPETRRGRLVREVAEQIVAQQRVGDLQAALAAHPLFPVVGDDGELALDVLLATQLLLHPVVDFMCEQLEVGPLTQLEAGLEEALTAACGQDDRGRFL